MSYKGQFTQKPLCQIFRFLRGREVPYGVGGEEWPCIVFRILYILVTGQKSAIISIPVTILLLLYGIFLFVFFVVLQALKGRERKRKILNSKDFTLSMPKPSGEMPGFSMMTRTHATVRKATSW